MVVPGAGLAGDGMAAASHSGAVAHIHPHLIVLFVCRVAKLPIRARRVEFEALPSTAKQRGQLTQVNALTRCEREPVTCGSKRRTWRSAN